PHIFFADIKDVNGLIESVRKPDLPFIRCQPYSMTRASMPFHRTCMKSLYFDMSDFLPCFQIPGLKAQQSVYIHIATGLFSIDRKRPDIILKWPHFGNNFLISGIYNR